MAGKATDAFQLTLLAPTVKQPPSSADAAPAFSRLETVSRVRNHLDLQMLSKKVQQIGKGPEVPSGHGPARDTCSRW